MRSRSRPNSRQRPSCSLSPHQRIQAAEGVRPPLPDILRRALPSSPRLPGNSYVAFGGYHRATPFRLSRAPSGSCLGRSHTPRDRWPRGWPPPSASDLPRLQCALLLSPRAYLLAQRCSVRAAAQPMPRRPRTQLWRELRQRTGPRACDDDISRGSFSQRKYTGRVFIPNGIFWPPPRATRPVESSLCVSRKCRAAATISSSSTLARSREETCQTWHSWPVTDTSESGPTGSSSLLRRGPPTSRWST